jgi:hypothetical protein
MLASYYSSGSSSLSKATRKCVMEADVAKGAGDMAMQLTLLVDAVGVKVKGGCCQRWQSFEQWMCRCGRLHCQTP